MTLFPGIALVTGAASGIAFSYLRSMLINDLKFEKMYSKISLQASVVRQQSLSLLKAVIRSPFVIAMQKGW
jgi:hypothetical protein